MKRRMLVYALAAVLVTCLVTVGVYGLRNPGTTPQESETAPTAIPTPTPTSTPVPTVPPAPGVTSINFTRWHPSTTGENIITVAYPTENAAVESSNISLKIYAASKNICWSINSIYYTADWLGNDSRRCFSGFDNLFTDNVELTINFHDIPDGYHTFTAYLNVHDYSNATVTVHFTTRTT